MMLISQLLGNLLANVEPESGTRFVTFLVLNQLEHLEYFANILLLNANSGVLHHNV